MAAAECTGGPLYRPPHRSLHHHRGRAGKMEIIVLHRERRLRHGLRGDDGLASNCYLIFANLMQAGEGTSSTWPVGVRWPVCGSILKITMLLEFWLAATREEPPGAISKLRGFLP